MRLAKKFLVMVAVSAFLGVSILTPVVAQTISQQDSFWVEMYTKDIFGIQLASVTDTLSFTYDLSNNQFTSYQHVGFTHSSGWGWSAGWGSTDATTNTGFMEGSGSWYMNGPFNGYSGTVDVQLWTTNTVGQLGGYYQASVTSGGSQSWYSPITFEIPIDDSATADASFSS